MQELRAKFGGGSPAEIRALEDKYEAGAPEAAGQHPVDIKTHPKFKPQLRMHYPHAGEAMLSRIALTIYKPYFRQEIRQCLSDHRWDLVQRGVEGVPSDIPLTKQTDAFMPPYAAVYSTIVAAWEDAAEANQALKNLSLIHISEPTRPY